MITLAIFIGIGFLLGIPDLEKMAAYMLVGAFIGCFAGLCVKNETIEIKHVEYLETIQDNKTINGSFFLGCGYIDEAWKYTYYVKKGEDYYFEQMKVEGTPVRYTNGMPRIEWIERVKTDCKLNNYSLRGSGFKSKKTIYIPEGTIKQNYTLDAKK